MQPSLLSSVPPAACLLVTKQSTTVYGLSVSYRVVYIYYADLNKAAEHLKELKKTLGLKHKTHQYAVRHTQKVAFTLCPPCCGIQCSNQSRLDSCGTLRRFRRILPDLYVNEVKRWFHVKIKQ